MQACRVDTLKEIIGLNYQPSELTLTKPPNEKYEFTMRQQLIEWVQANLCK